MRLFINELQRFYWETKRYYPDFIVSTLVSFIIFLIFVAFNKDIQSEYISYFFWVLGSNVLSEASISISMEKQMGTLKNIMLKPYSIISIMTYRTISYFIINFVKVILIIILIKLILPIKIIFNPIILVALLLTMISFYGLSMILMALTIVYTKTASFETIISYSLLLFSGIIVPLESMPKYFQIISNFSPLYLGIKISKNIINNNFNLNDLKILSLQSLFFIILGYFIFKFIMKNASNFSMVY